MIAWLAWGALAWVALGPPAAVLLGKVIKHADREETRHGRDHR